PSVRSSNPTAGGSDPVRIRVDPDAEAVTDLLPAKPAPGNGRRGVPPETGATTPVVQLTTSGRPAAAAGEIRSRGRATDTGAPATPSRTGTAVPRPGTTTHRVPSPSS